MAIRASKTHLFLTGELGTVCVRDKRRKIIEVVAFVRSYGILRLERGCCNRTRPFASNGSATMASRKWKNTWTGVLRASRRLKRKNSEEFKLRFINPISVGAATVRLPVEVYLHFCRCGFIGNRFRCVRTRCIGGS